MSDDRHVSTECTGCEWERQPQAYRWFPELGRPLEPSRLIPDPPTRSETTGR